MHTCMEVFDKATFNRVNICTIQNEHIDETDSKQPKIHRKIHTSLWILKISMLNAYLMFDTVTLRFPVMPSRYFDCEVICLTKYNQIRLKRHNTLYGNLIESKCLHMTLQRSVAA